MSDYYFEQQQIEQDAEMAELDREYWERIAPPKTIDEEYRSITRFEKFCMVCMLVAEIVIVGLVLGGIK